MTQLPARVFRVFPRPAAERVNVQVIVVTLPAFAAMLEEHDINLNEHWPRAGMDHDWTAVPIPSDVVNEPWLPEYLLCHLNTSVWAGRLSYSTNTSHSAAAARHPTYFTQIPHSHNVSIPGPTKLMLVLLDENTNCRNTELPILREEGMNVYPGSSYVRQAEFDIAHYQVDYTDMFHDLLNNHNQSANRMCSALEWMESNTSCDMAFQLAFSLAAELSATLPESPTLEVGAAVAHRYADPLNGAWTFGVHNFSNDNPRHTSSDITAGALANRSDTFTGLVNGYNWAAVSPLQQYAHSQTAITNEAVIEDNQIVAYRSFWTNPNVTKPRPQYQAHCAHSVFRILSALGFIEKNDYHFQLRTPAGLQSMIVLQASALSLSTALYLTRNDLDRWMWSFLQQANINVTKSANNKVSTVTLNHIIPVCTATTLASNSRVGVTIKQDIERYYGIEINRNEWALSICMPYFAVLQWAAKFEIPMFLAIKSVYGNVTDDYTTQYVEVDATTRSALPWYASTGNSYRRIPRVRRDVPHATPTFVPTSLDNWAVQTLGRSGPSPNDNGFVSNVLCLSMRYHYRDVSKHGSALILSNYTADMAATLWSVSPTEYPDPPNMSFLYKVVRNAGSGEQKESPVAELRLQHSTGPTQALSVAPAPVPREGDRDPPTNPLLKQGSPRNSMAELSEPQNTQ